jgi:hypothetical protein
MFPRSFEPLRLFALDPYDLALSKLERNEQLDRDDVKYLARTIPLDITVLQHRYHRPIRQAKTPAVGLRFGDWDKRFDEFPQRVRQKVDGHRTTPCRRDVPSRSAGFWKAEALLDVL